MERSNPSGEEIQAALDAIEDYYEGGDVYAAYRDSAAILLRFEAGWTLPDIIGLYNEDVLDVAARLDGTTGGYLAMAQGALLEEYSIKNGLLFRRLFKPHVDGSKSKIDTRMSENGLRKVLKTRITAGRKLLRDEKKKRRR